MSNYSRLDVAIESLMQARMHFESGNFICAVILSGAAQRVLRDLCRNQSIVTTVEIIEAETGHHWRAVDALLTACFNKTKHARKDSCESVSIGSEDAKALMAVAASDLAKLFKGSSKEVSDFYEFITKI